MSGALRHFIRESLVTEIEQKRWMGAKSTTSSAATAEPEAGIMGWISEKVKGALKYISTSSLLRGRRAGSAWTRKAGFVAVAGGLGSLAWSALGKKTGDENATQEAVNDSEKALLDVSDQIMELFASKDRELSDAIGMRNPKASDAGIETETMIENLKKHYNSIVSKSRGISLNARSPSTADYESFFNSGPGMLRFKGDVDPIVSNNDAKRAEANKIWASRVLTVLLAERISVEIQRDSDTIARKIEGIADDKNKAALRSKVDSVIGDIGSEMDTVQAFKIASEAIKE